MEKSNWNGKLNKFLLTALVILFAVSQVACGQPARAVNIKVVEPLKNVRVVSPLGEIQSTKASQPTSNEPQKPFPSQEIPPEEIQTPKVSAQPEISQKPNSIQLPFNKQLKDLPGSEDKREDVISLVGSPDERKLPIASIIWHWTWTEPTGGDGVEIVRIKGVPSYHLCILPQNIDDVFAKFQYLVDIKQIAYHTNEENETSIGISYIGKGPPTPQQETTRRLLTLWLMGNLGIGPENIKVHKEVGYTDDIAGVRGMNVNDPRWQEGIDWERKKLASIQRGLHPETWARKDGDGKWIIPNLKDDALSVQEASTVARMVAENWGIPADDVFLSLISSESNFRQWEVDGRVVEDSSGDGGQGIGQIVARWHPEVNMEKARNDAGHNLNESARILLGFNGSWEEKVLQYKGNRQDFLAIFQKVRDSEPPFERETGLPEWTRQFPKTQPFEIQPKVVERGPSNRQIIALTFDGGWADRQGEDTLRVLRELNVQCTIFLTGQYIEAGPDLVRQMVQDGHEIGNHTYSHPDNFAAASRQQIEKELQATEEAFQKLIGQQMTKWFRFPGGSYSNDSVQVVYQNGYQAIQWSVASTDWEDIPAEKIFNDVVGKAHPGAIAVLHFGGKNTAAALRLIIPELRNKGYRLVTLSEMFQ